MHSQALMPYWLSHKSVLAEGVYVASAVVLLSLLAQLTVPLPWTPIPITGQTFGVILISLLSGWARSGAVMVIYLGTGLAGAPVFADADNGAELGPTFGYLMGMAVAAVVIGYLADKGFANTFAKAIAAALLGTLIIFALGIAGLSLFLPYDALLAAGVLPFVPGALIKSVLAAGIACWLDTHIAGARHAGECDGTSHAQ